MIFACYGSLKKGYGNNVLLEKAKFLGTFKTKPLYTLLDGGFPIVERLGTTSITVELYETNDEAVIDNVNHLEGCTGKQHDPNNWYDFDEIGTPFGVARIFVMNKGKSGRRDVVENGLWERSKPHSYA